MKSTFGALVVLQIGGFDQVVDHLFGVDARLLVVVELLALVGRRHLGPLHRSRVAESRSIARIPSRHSKTTRAAQQQQHRKRSKGK